MDLFQIDGLHLSVITDAWFGKLPDVVGRDFWAKKFPFPWQQANPVSDLDTATQSTSEEPCIHSFAPITTPIMTVQRIRDKIKL